ncbi:MULTISPECIES: Hsp20/alpha crystallin family protein [Sphingobacterium]|uniref:Hsp20/alpha crystallin family protein n=1 Tax=Sphingobacterium TaxID=28453 RepID=UPI0016264078|nr:MULTISPECIES: Hsp20/alpha crystallin family protein [Sphingobacterium]MBV2225608.1 Hsp20/alpha crystallin family protein [Sphingobacterium mizutaii]
MFRRETYNQDAEAQQNFCRSNFKRKFDRFQNHFFNEGNPFNRSQKANIPVNIAENEELYQVQVYAAGRKKEQFQVNITDQVLTITCKAAELEPGLKYIYQEQQLGEFERAFQLQDEILLGNVHASFEDGILTVILQKDPSKIKPAQEVQVS